MKYYIIAGEASGDLHASNLIRAIKNRDPNAEIRAWGGEKMQNEGAQLVMHYKETAIMGFVEVIKNLKKIIGLFGLAKEDIRSFAPNVVIFVDYPGFNLRLAKWVHTRGYKSIYYITPSVWAWNKKRAIALRKYIGLSIPILPFEKEFLDTFGVQCIYCGNPVVDAISRYKLKAGSFSNQNCIAILPGSRVQEVKRMLPVMLQGAAKIDPHSQIFVSTMSSIPMNLYLEAQQKAGIKDVEFYEGNAYDIIVKSKIAIVASGTATLEVALLKTPQIVCYIGSSISVNIARLLLDIKFISLPNLIMGESIVPELIQEACNVEKISQAADEILSNPTKVGTKYEMLSEKLGAAGASDKAAAAIINFIQ
jgi:lipid-A-disaccharide synthase